MFDFSGVTTRDCLRLFLQTELLHSGRHLEIPRAFVYDNAKGGVIMRLGGSIPKAYGGAAQWAEDVRALGFTACTCPLPGGAGADEAARLMKAAKEADIVIAEVGVWKNTLSPNDEQRRGNIAYAKERLALADELGARCCVNIAGARGDIWDGGYPQNYDEQTRELLIDTVRDIIDAVKPKRTFYTLEPMPWMLPDDADSYLALLRDVDRPAFAVHMDFVNMLSSPARFLRAPGFIRECFEKLAPYIKSVHIKDATMHETRMPAVIEECPPGRGTLDYARILRIIDDTLQKDTPVLLEHMNTTDEYAGALAYVLRCAAEANVTVYGA